MRKCHSNLRTNQAQEHHKALWILFIFKVLISCLLVPGWGSLDQILSNDTHATAFDEEKRVNDVKGVANAWSYMHHECSPPIVHCDISSKNVLLDAEYEAHVSDFGTAKFLKSGSHNWTPFTGTFGYAAPELAQAMEVNEKCDVEEVVSIARLAFSRLRTSPRSRPTMDQVSKAFVITRSPLTDEFHVIRLGQLQ